MLSNAQNYLSSTPWLAVYPGALILLTIVAVNVFGDALRDATDPVLRLPGEAEPPRHEPG
jgi:peptide/nickel transport system permease protein